MANKKRKADGSHNSAKFCQWCKDNNRADKADTHAQANFTVLDKKLKSNNANKPCKKQRINNKLNAMLKKSGMSKEEIIAALKETEK